MMLRSWATICDLSEPAVSRPQIFTASGIIARALMICELRAIESRCRLARLWKPLASPNGPWVTFWLTTAIVNRTRVEATTMKPRSGWTRNTATMNSGASGASRKESSVPETRNERSCWRSPSVWYSRPLLCSEARAAALRIGAPSWAATSTAVRIRMKRRMASSTDCRTTAPTMTAVSITSVSSERLVSTRSEIWNR